MQIEGSGEMNENGVAPWVHHAPRPAPTIGEDAYLWPIRGVF
jgi:hypothetical protein